MTTGYLTNRQLDQLLKRAIIQPNGCVIWSGAKNRKGYGVVKLGGRSEPTRLTHRVMYALFVGNLIPGLQIDHLCKVPACMAPAHLEQVTPRINVQRSDAGLLLRERAKRITHCPRGHPYNEENTYRPPRAKYNTRMCRECMRRRWREWRDRTRGKS